MSYLEKERRFLVNDEMFEHIFFKCDSENHIQQIYLVDREDHSLRIRIINNVKATICYKYYLDSESKEEHEYPFSYDNALAIFKSGDYVSMVSKTRYELDGWDVDIYYNNDGIIIAEFEFSDEKPFPEVLPDWIEREVTGEYEYTNLALAKK